MQLLLMGTLYTECDMNAWQQIWSRDQPLYKTGVCYVVGQTDTILIELYKFTIAPLCCTDARKTRFLKDV